MTTSAKRVAAGDRREFLKQLGGGMLLTSLGVGLTRELGLAATAFEPDLDDPLRLGTHLRRVDLLTHTPLDELQPALVREIDQGASLAELTAAGALANARAFGGEDYDGYHAFMALMPAFEMSQELKGREAALPVLKVLYRNTARMQNAGFDDDPVVKSALGKPETLPRGVDDVLARVHAKDKAGAEATFHSLARSLPEKSVEHLIPVVCQEVDVHRVVLAWRTWDLARLTGREHAPTLMRQSIRQCVEREGKGRTAIRHELPAVMEDTKLFESPLGRRAVEDAWIESLAQELTNSDRKAAASRVAEALRDGIAPDAIGEALSLASTFIMLRQNPAEKSSRGKRKGSVHGAGPGVHSSDTAAAWRAMARFGSTRQTQLALVAGAYHVAGQSDWIAPEWFEFWNRKFESLEADALLGMLRECLADQDQAGAAAAARCYGRRKHPLDDIFAVLRDASVRADGALHAEKYYRTQVEAINGDRPAFRELHLAALARVCASQAYADAPGRGQALELLG